MEGFDPKQPSQGLGDTIAKVTHFFGIDKVADAVAKIAGAEGCGCAERQQMLNELFKNFSNSFSINGISKCLLLCLSTMIFLSISFNGWSNCRLSFQAICISL